MIIHKVKITNTKNKLSKIIDLDNYKAGEAMKIFKFYASHRMYLIEFV